MGSYLLMRLDAPLVSFGGPRVDQEGVTMEFPGLSLIAGLLGNALGFTHADADDLEELQRRIRYAVRCDRRPEPLLDYQTVDLGQPFLVGTGWTTRGEREDRTSGSKEGTHIRFQRYLADGVFTVVLGLADDNAPNLADLEDALRLPERPLFFGRKACLPAGPICLGQVEARSLVDALRVAPRVEGDRATGDVVSAWWPEGEPADEAGPESRLLAVADERDWRNQVHTGRRFVRHGRIALKGASA